MGRACLLLAAITLAVLLQAQPADAGWKSWSWVYRTQQKSNSFKRYIGDTGSTEHFGKWRRQERRCDAPGCGTATRYCSWSYSYGCGWNGWSTCYACGRYSYRYSTAVGTYQNRYTEYYSQCAPGRYYISAYSCSSWYNTIGYCHNFGGRRQACFVCTTGQYQDQWGKYTSCKGCTTGKYQNQRGTHYCKNCPAGQYSDQTYRTGCKNCPGGKYQNQVGQRGCKTCPVGHYSPPRAGGCTACPKGKYQPFTGQSSCYTCPAGKYTSSTGRTSCSVCSYTNYQDQTGQAGCKSLGTGYYGNGRYYDMHTTRSACSRGYYCQAGGRFPCGCCGSSSCGYSSSMYSGTSGASWSTSRCSNSQWYNSWSVRSTCYKIPAGKYGALGSQNVAPFATYSTISCTYGKYQNQLGQRTCKNCGSMQYNDQVGRTSCKGCKACNYPTYFYNHPSYCRPGGTSRRYNSHCLTCSQCALNQKVTRQCGGSIYNTGCAAVLGPPTLTITGSSVVSVNAARSGQWSDPGCSPSTCTKDYGAWNRDLNDPGQHIVRYSVSNSQYTTYAFRVVNVVDRNPPTISFGSSYATTVEAGGVLCPASNPISVCPEPFDRMKYVTASDDVDGTITNQIRVSGSVSAQPGTYTVVYQVTDRSGKSTSQSKTITVKDRRAPEAVRLNGASSVTLDTFESWADPGAVAIDRLDGAMVPTITYAAGTWKPQASALTSKPGTYTATYKFTDRAGRSSQVTRTIVVVDKDPPVISVNPTAVVIEAGTAYTGHYSGVSVVDAHCSTTKSYTGSVNTNVPGTYTLTYAAKDCKNNQAATKQRHVIVQDTRAPTITLSPTTVTVNAARTGSYSTKVGYSLSDPSGITTSAQLGQRLVASPATIAKNAPGSYTVTFTVSDLANNAATHKTRVVNVIDNVKPVINGGAALPLLTVQGGGKWCQDQTAVCPDEWVDPLFAVSDNLDTSAQVLDTIEVAGTVNKLKKGDYKLTYTVSDRAGNTATAQRTVRVVDTQPPVVHLNGGDMTLPVDSVFNDPSAVALDQMGTFSGSLTLTTTGSVDTSTVGTYTLTYTATDGSGLKATATRTVTVKPKSIQKPVVTLNGSPVVRVEAGGFSLADYEFGCTATDEQDGTVSCSVDSNPVPAAVAAGNVPADLVVTYSATNSVGLTTTAVRHVIVEDTTPPVMTRKGASPLTVAVGASYSDPGVTLSDSQWSAGSSQLQTLAGSLTTTPGSVSTSAPTSVTITYTATDVGGNKVSTTRLVRVTDQTAPTITIKAAMAATTIEGGGRWCSSDKTSVCPSPFVDVVEQVLDVSDNVDDEAALLSEIITTGAVDKTAVGTYTLSYSVTDAAGNKATAALRTVTVQDTEAPFLTLLGQSSLQLQAGDAYIEAGVLALDRLDSFAGNQVTWKASLAAADINTNVPGTHTIVYSASDAAGNAATTVSRTVTIVDASAPKLTLIGDALTFVEAGTSYTEPSPGASAVDFEDSNPNIVGPTWSPAFDINKPGAYSALYTATDAKGNPSNPVTRRVIVQDTTAPVISVPSLSVALAAGAAEPTITPTLSDPNGVSSPTYLAGQLTRTSTFQTTPGTYTITFATRDKAGNAAIPVVVTVVVTDATAPTLNLLGDASVSIEAGGRWCDATLKTSVCPRQWTDPGATATDNVDDDTIMTESISVDGTVDVLTPATYTLTYSVEDTAGLETTAVRTVTVADTTAPVILLLNPAVTVQVGHAYEPEQPRAIDLLDSLNGDEITVKSSGSVDLTTAGTYTVTFSASDAAGNNAAPKTLTITVVDGSVPVITLLGKPFIALEATVGSEYNEETPGATASDASDPDITVVTEGLPVSLDAPGTFTITYTATDKNGLTADPMYRTIVVEDTTQPTITLTGDTTINLEAGVDSFAEPGYTVDDNGVTSQANLAANFHRLGVPDNDADLGNAVGAFEISYHVTDDSGNAAIVKTRQLQFLDRTPPVITVSDDTTSLTLEAGGRFCAGTKLSVCPPDVEDLLPTATATDFADASVNSKIVMSENINLLEPGAYSMTFNVVDNAGLSADEKVVTVNVQDTQPPVITLLGQLEIEIEGGETYVDPGAVAYDETDSLAVGSVAVTDDHATAVDTSVPGEYTVTYAAVDRAGNAAAKVTRKVVVIDTTKPVITVNAPLYTTLEAGDAYTDPGATASDVVDDNTALSALITVQGVPASGTWTTVGNKVITYDVIDSSGAVAETASRLVVVVDTTKPTLTLVGDASITVDAHPTNTYTDAGVATASDIVSSEAYLKSQLVVTNHVLLSRPGTYKVTWTTSDEEGNVQSIDRTVVVQDVTAPVITLVGPAALTIEAGGRFCTVDPQSPSICPHGYEDAGATATDDLDDDNDLTALIVVTGEVDPATPGVYTLTFDVADQHDNSAASVSRTVTVQDTAKPRPILEGPLELSIEAGDTWSELGATCVDEVDTHLGNAMPAVIDASNLDTVNPGSYQITYTCTDAAGNVGMATRAIHVIDTQQPVITMTGDSPVVLEAGSVYNDAGATAADVAGDTDLTNDIVVAGADLDTKVPGRYEVTYNVVDSENLAALTVTRVVLVLDSTRPTLSLVGGDATVDHEAATPYVDAGVVLSDIVTSEATLRANLVETDHVNPNIRALGLHQFSYTTHDEANNLATISRTIRLVDNTKPTVTLEGDVAPFVWQAGGRFCDGSILHVCAHPFVDPGYKAADTVDGDLSANVVVTGEVLTNTPSETPYELTYTVTDKTGNTNTATRMVKVIDTRAPAITLNGEDTVIVEGGSTYVDVGAVCVDETDTLRTGAYLDTSMVSTVDTSVVGDHTVTFSCVDSSSNSAEQVVRTVTVQDTSKPRLHLTGKAYVFVEGSASYDDAGATATDVIDDDATLTDSIVTGGLPIDTMVVGEHTVTYDVVDSRGLAADQISRTVAVIDTTRPVVTLRGPSFLTHEAGTTYVDDGVDLSDNVTPEPFLRQHLVVHNNVKNGSLGTYTVLFTTKDESNNDAVLVARQVQVIDTTKPDITLLGDNPFVIEAGETYQDPGANAWDFIDGDITYRITSVSNVDTRYDGNYTVNYTVSDARSGRNNKAFATRTVNVVDTTRPIITLLPVEGGEFMTIEGSNPFQDPWVNVTDYVTDDQELINRVDVAGYVDHTRPGLYTLTYTVTDNANNPALAVNRTVQVVDTTPPEIYKIVDGSPLVWEAAVPYVDAGVRIRDLVDDEATLQLLLDVDTDEVDFMNVGNYTVYYTVVDTSLNPDSAERLVVVLDTRIPNMTLLGPASTTREAVLASDDYTDPGVEVWDAVDQRDQDCHYQGDCAANMNTVVTGLDAVDTNQPGTYTITYDTTDLSGNKAVQLSRDIVIIDTTDPVLQLQGNDFVEQIMCPLPALPTLCVQGQTYEVAPLTTTTDRACAPVEDAPNGTDTTVVQYPCADTEVFVTQGASTSCQVWNGCAAVGLVYTDAGANATDIVDGVLTDAIVVTNPVDVRIAEVSYFVFYEVEDAHGNKANATREVYVRCPDGSYWANQTCVLCEVGYQCGQAIRSPCSADEGSRGAYQDEIGQSTCKSCPPYSKSLSISATSALHCTCQPGFEASYTFTELSCVDVVPPTITFCPSDPLVHSMGPGLNHLPVQQAGDMLSVVKVEDNCLRYDSSGTLLSNETDFPQVPDYGCTNFEFYHTDGTPFDRSEANLPAGSSEFVLVAVDAEGLTSGTCQLQVEIVDDQAPLLDGCPVDMVLSTDPGRRTAAVEFDLYLSDNYQLRPEASFDMNMCQGNETDLRCTCSLGVNDCDTPSGCLVGPGVHQMSLKAVDSAGNEGPSCLFSVTVVDNEAASAECPADIIVNAADVAIPEVGPNVTLDVCSPFEYHNADGACMPWAPLIADTPATWVSRGHFDNFDLDGVFTSHASGTEFPLSVSGPSVIEHTVSDSNGNRASCEFSVTVCPPGTWGTGCSGGVCPASCNTTCHPGSGECMEESLPESTLSDSVMCSTPRGNEATNRFSFAVLGLGETFFHFAQHRAYFTEKLQSVAGPDASLSVTFGEPVINTGVGVYETRLEALFELSGSQSDLLQNNNDDFEQALRVLFGADVDTIDIVMHPSFQCSGTDCTTGVTMLFPLMSDLQAQQLIGRLTTKAGSSISLNYNDLSLRLESTKKEANTDVTYSHPISVCAVSLRAAGDELHKALEDTFGLGCQVRLGGAFLDSLDERFSGTFIQEWEHTSEFAVCKPTEYETQDKSCQPCNCGSFACTAPVLADRDPVCSDAAFPTAAFVFEGINYFKTLGDPTPHTNVKLTINDVAAYIKQAAPSLDQKDIFMKLGRQGFGRRRSTGDIKFTASGPNKEDIDEIDALLKGACVQLTLLPGGCTTATDASSAEAASSSSSAGGGMVIGAAVGGLLILALLVAFLVMRRRKATSKTANDRGVVAFTNPIYGDEADERDSALYDDPDVDKDNPLYVMSTGEDDGEDFDDPLFVKSDKVGIAKDEVMYDEPDSFGFAPEDGVEEEEGYLDVHPDAPGPLYNEADDDDDDDQYLPVAAITARLQSKSSGLSNPSYNTSVASSATAAALPTYDNQEAAESEEEGGYLDFDPSAPSAVLDDGDVYDEAEFDDDDDEEQYLDM
eukprot:m.477476 g.477476  ORF g.477476 m.477476 type:complete len:4581 (-) comp20853_c0_seq1:124-13866(-)